MTPDHRTRRAVAKYLTAFLLVASQAFATEPAYRDLERSFEERAADLVARMTLEEKVVQRRAYAVDAGTFEVQLCASSSDIRLKSSFAVKVPE